MVNTNVGSLVAGERNARANVVSSAILPVKWQDNISDSAIDQSTNLGSLLPERFSATVEHSICPSETLNNLSACCPEKVWNIEADHDDFNIPSPDDNTEGIKHLH
jgi:hypothetical protein